VESGALQQHVNDLPYVVCSFRGVAMDRAFPSTRENQQTTRFGDGTTSGNVPLLGVARGRRTAAGAVVRAGRGAAPVRPSLFAGAAPAGRLAGEPEEGVCGREAVAAATTQTQAHCGAPAAGRAGKANQVWSVDFVTDAVCDREWERFKASDFV